MGCGKICARCCHCALLCVGIDVCCCDVHGCDVLVHRAFLCVVVWHSDVVARQCVLLEQQETSHRNVRASLPMHVPIYPEEQAAEVAIFFLGIPLHCLQCNKRKMARHVHDNLSAVVCAMDAMGSFCTQLWGCLGRNGTRLHHEKLICE